MVIPSSSRNGRDSALALSERRAAAAQRNAGCHRDSTSVPPATARAGTSRRDVPTRQCGALHIEMLVALALLIGALFPIAYSFASENRLARVCYERAVAMEIVDGEMEVLAAGGWRAFAPGTHDYPVRAAAAANLSAGQFVVTIEPGKVRLEWRPAAKHHGGPVVREVMIK